MMRIKQDKRLNKDVSQSYVIESNFEVIMLKLMCAAQFFCGKRINIKCKGACNPILF